MNEEQAIRDWFDTWKAATERGDLQAVIDLYAEDAVFLLPGGETMDREPFAEGVTNSPEKERDYIFEGGDEIVEIQVFGDHAVEPTVDSPGEAGVDHRGGGVAQEVRGNQLFVGRRENAVKLPARRFAEEVVDLGNRDVLLALAARHLLQNGPEVLTGHERRGRAPEVPRHPH